MPIFLVLLTALVPSAGVVWMMRQAVRNERYASERKLRDLYEVQTTAAAEHVERLWVQRWTAAVDTAESLPAPSAFASLITSTDADAASIHDVDGTLLYPSIPDDEPFSDLNLSKDFQAAESLEFVERDYRAAADAYHSLAAIANDAALTAAAKRAEARCLIAQGRVEPAAILLDQLRADAALLDQRGRSFALAAESRLLELLPPQGERWSSVAYSIVERLGDYIQKIPSSQRRYMMERLHRSDSKRFDWPTRSAELLSADLSDDPSPERVWTQTSPSRAMTVYYQTDTLIEQVEDFANRHSAPAGCRYVVSQWRGQSIRDTNHALLSQQSPLSENPQSPTSGIRLGLIQTIGPPADDASRFAGPVITWIAMLILLATGISAWLLLRSLRQRLQVAALKNDLVATVSHELKTPLASIRLLVDTLIEARSATIEEASLVDKQTNEYLGLISQENRRLSRLIDKFLTFSRVQRSIRLDATDSVVLNDLIERSVAIFMDHHPSSESCLSVHSAPEASVLGDRDALITALVNLLENAWKYGGDEPNVTIRGGITAEQAWITVEDQGIGMTPLQTKRIFERFYQVDQRVSRTHGGCGLGLRHRPRDCGESSRQHRRHQQSRTRKHLSIEFSPTPMTNKVLIIEDDPALRRGLSDNFQLKGWSVTLAEDGCTGLAEALTETADLIVLDLMLPAMNGYEVCRQLRSRGLLVPILMLTAKGQESDIVRGFEVGANDYLTKPFGIRELMARANRLTAHSIASSSPVAVAPLALGNCNYDPSTRRLDHPAGSIAMTAKEAALLDLLRDNEGIVLTRSRILDLVWGRSRLTGPRSVDRAVTTLRKKLQRAAGDWPQIQTVHGVGYRFRISDC